MSKSKIAVPTIFGGNALAYATLSLVSIFCVIPFIWMFLASFDGNAALFLRFCPNKALIDEDYHAQSGASA